MKFEWDNKLFDTDDMHPVPATAPYHWGIFITRDYSHVFAPLLLPVSGITVRPVVGEALHHLAELLNNPHLTKAWQNYTADTSQSRESA